MLEVQPCRTDWHEYVDERTVYLHINKTSQKGQTAQVNYSGTGVTANLNVITGPRLNVGYVGASALRSLDKSETVGLCMAERES